MFEVYLFALSTLLVLLFLMMGFVVYLSKNQISFNKDALDSFDKLAKAILKWFFLASILITIVYWTLPLESIFLSFGSSEISRLKSGVCLLGLLFGALVVAYLAFFICLGMIEGIIDILNGNISHEDRKQYQNIQRVDRMSGQQFECFCKELLEYNGYSEVKLTPASGDQGVDITARKGNIRYAFQCKKYTNQKVGNSAVQEVYTGKAYYKCSSGVVITNSYFTHKAKEIARVNRVLLWDRDELKEIMNRAAKAKYP